MMNPLKLRFYTERIEKDNRNVQIFSTYAPPSKLETLTGKFYAKHESSSLIKPPHEFVRLIEKKKSLRPNQIYEFEPPCVNMEYGFFTQDLIEKSQDERLRFPRIMADFIKTELTIRHANKGMPVEKFTGVPFKS